MNLDNIEQMRELDSQDQVGSVTLLGKQFLHGWEDVHKLEIPEEYSKAQNIVFCGMGGSSLGAYVTKHIYGLTLGVPYEIMNDYHIPSYVDENTLVIVQSYSGNTEEALSCFDEAIETGAHIFTISAGGKLEERSKRDNCQHYHIEPKFNPCDQPRMGIGYSIVGQLAMLHQAGFIHITEQELKDIEAVTEQNAKDNHPEVPLSSNSSKHIAELMFDKIPLYIGAQFLQGAMHAMRNQVNENAKTYAGEHPVPEMNHHLLEALSFPKSTQNHDLYVFIESDLYSDRVKRRNEVVKEIIQKTGHNVTSIQAKGTYPISQVMYCIQYGAFIGFYLAMKEGIDPSPIPYVEDLKVML